MTEAMFRNVSLEINWNLNLPGPPNYKINVLASLPGTRCYTDASITHDTHLQVKGKAGLRVFIINSSKENKLNVFVKASLKDSNLVLMAEPSALALGENILKILQVQRPFFLTGDQQLVTFFNGRTMKIRQDDIKPYTQSFVNIISENEGRI